MVVNPEEAIDAAKPVPIPAVQIWWSREEQRFIAAAPTIKGIIGVGKTFTEAANNLASALTQAEIKG